MAGEILYPAQTPNEVVNQQLRDDRSRPVDQLQYVAPGNALRPIRTVNNTFNLVPGAYPAPTLSVAGTLIQGAAGTTLAGLTASAQGIVRDCRFTGVVTVSPTGVVVFDRCVFDSPTAVNALGKAVFTACHFAEPITNAGLPANVGIVGCSRTGAIHVNVTIIYEVS